MRIVSRDRDLDLSWDDVSNSGSLPEGTTAVINVSGANILKAPFEHKTDLFWYNLISSRVNTTRALRQAILSMKSPPKVFACISGVGYYPYSETVTYTESSPGGEGNFFAELCRDWEAESVLPHGHPTRRVVIRSGVVVGPGGGIMSQVYLPFFFGLGGPIGMRGSQFFPFIALDDLVRMFLFAVEEDHVTGVLNGVAPQVITNKEFAQSMGKVMKRPAAIPFPDAVVRLLYGDTRADVLLEGMRVVPKRTMDLGFTYDYGNIHDTIRRGLKYI